MEKIDKENHLIYDRIIAAETLHAQTCRDDRTEMKADMKDALKAFGQEMKSVERRLKEHIDLKVKSGN